MLQLCLQLYLHIYYAWPWFIKVWAYNGPYVFNFAFFCPHWFLCDELLLLLPWFGVNLNPWLQQLLNLYATNNRMGIRVWTTVLACAQLIKFWILWLAIFFWRVEASKPVVNIPMKGYYMYCMVRWCVKEWM